MLMFFSYCKIADLFYPKMYSMRPIRVNNFTAGSFRPPLIEIFYRSSAESIFRASFTWYADISC